MTYNHEYFKQTRPSEHLLATAKAHLDALGHPNLKKELEEALFDGDTSKTQEPDPLSHLRNFGKDTDTVC